MPHRPGRQFEKKIYAKIRDKSGLTCNPQRKVIGESGTVWRVDAVLFRGNEPVTYLEIKYVGEKSSYETQYKLAFAQLADFSYSNIPGAVIVPEKRHPGNKKWESYFATIGCRIISQQKLKYFLATLQDFPTAPETSDPLEEYISEEVQENLGDEPLRLTEEEPEPDNEQVERLQDIWENVNQDQ